MAAPPDFKSETHFLVDGHERWERVYHRTINQKPTAFHLISMIGPKKYGFSQDASIPAFRWAGCARTEAKARRLIEEFVTECTEEAQQEANAQRIAVNRRRAKKGKSQLPMKEVPRQADADIMMLPGRTWFLWPPKDKNSIEECTDIDNVYKYVERYIDYLQEQAREIEKRIKEDRSANDEPKSEPAPVSEHVPEQQQHHEEEEEEEEEEAAAKDIVPFESLKEEQKEEEEEEPVVAEPKTAVEPESESEPVYKAERQELEDGVVITEKDDEELRRVLRKMEKTFTEAQPDDLRLAETTHPYVMLTVVYPFSRYKPGHERQFLMRIEGAFTDEAKEVQKKIHEENYESLFNVCIGQHMHWHPLPISVHTVKNRVMTDCKILESTDRLMARSKKERTVDEEAT